MMRTPDLIKFGKKHQLNRVTTKELIAYRMVRESLVHRASEAAMPTEYGMFTAIAFQNEVDHECHIALVKGEIKADVPTLVRVHSGCVTGDIFRSNRCDCGEQLHAAMQQIRGLAVSQSGRAWHRAY